MFFLILFTILIIAYVCEVIVGSCVGAYNAEIGCESSCDKLKKLTNKEYFTQLMPLIIVFVGLPLILYEYLVMP